MAQVDWFGTVGAAAVQMGSVTMWSGASAQYASPTSFTLPGACVPRCCANAR